MTLPPMPGLPDGHEAAWPAPGYRSKQKPIYREAANAVFGDNDIDTVIIDAPTGIGKSVINTGLCNLAESAFYTTPLKVLRRQLEDDGMLADHLNILRAREDYMCEEVSARTNESQTPDCDRCPISNAPDDMVWERNADPYNFEGEPNPGPPSAAEKEKGAVDDRTTVSCRSTPHYSPRGIVTPGCSYWRAKEQAIDAQTAAVTFAFLITDGFLPEKGDLRVNGELLPDEPVSFGDRELLVVDEAQTLEGQVASLFAGFDVARADLPQGVTDTIQRAMPQSLLEAAGDDGAVAPVRDHLVTEEMMMGLLDATDIARKKANELEKKRMQFLSMDPPQDLPPGEEELLDACGSFTQRIDSYLPEPADVEAEPWLVEAGYDDTDTIVFSFNPVHVDGFLKRRVWPRAETVVLSSATIPSYDRLNRHQGMKEWAGRIGRDPDSTHVISVDSPFPVENRRVYTESTVGRINSSSWDDKVEEMSETIAKLADRHAGEKGLVHTTSYDQANELADLLGDRAIADDPFDNGSRETMAAWHGDANSGNILISPSLHEGVDLEGDKCRWQALAKVPWAHLGDRRVNYLLNELDENEWYEGNAAIKIIQAAGRGVRGPDDTCAFYVLDESFNQVKGYLPGWFRESVGGGPEVTGE